MTLFAIGAAAICGCRTSPHLASFIENRNAEARQLEDEYWYQVQENERLASELNRLQRQKQHAPESLQPPRVEEGSGPPMIEIPDTPPATPPERQPRIEAEPPPEMPSELPPPRGAAPAPPAQREVIDEKVTHLFLNPLHTGGVDFDRRPGDDGLSLLLEPRNAADQFVPQAGNVSVVLLDPEKSGDAARIARWSFGSRETRLAISQEQDARGIRLEMPWPSRGPESGQLKLFVRYETADGRKIQTERDIYIKLAGEYSERWTPRPPERQRRNPPVDSAIVQQPAPAASAPDKVEPPIKEPAPTIADQPSPAVNASPPPALSDAPGKTPARPTWKPYR